MSRAVVAALVPEETTENVLEAASQLIVAVLTVAPDGYEPCGAPLYFATRQGDPFPPIDTPQAVAQHDQARAFLADHPRAVLVWCVVDYHVEGSCEGHA